MPTVVIVNPIINSPFEEPARHYQFDANDRLTNVVAEGRRPSTYFLPIAAPEKKAKQLTFDSLLDEERRTETDHVNRIRESVKR